MGLLDFFKGKSSEDLASKYERLVTEAAKEAGTNWWSVKPSQLKTYNEKIFILSDQEKVEFISETIKRCDNYHKGRKTYSTNDIEYMKDRVGETLIKHVLKTRLELTDKHIAELCTIFTTGRTFTHGVTRLVWPVGLLVNQIEKQIKQRGLSPDLRTSLSTIKKAISVLDYFYDEKDKLKLQEKIDAIIFKEDNTSEEVKPSYFQTEDEFGIFANKTIDEYSMETRIIWYKLVSMCRKASGSKPSGKYIVQGTALYKTLGPEKFKRTVNSWLEFIIKYKETEKQHVSEWQGRTNTHTYYQFLNSTNLDTLKGFVWLYTNFYDKATLFTISALAERAYRKIPGKGPAAAAIGNACMYVLAESRGLDGIGHLSRLKLRIKQSSARKTIDQYLVSAAKKMGVSLAEIEDMAADDFGLTNGAMSFDLEGYSAKLKITGIGKTTLNWFKPDGSPQKSVPALVKEKLAAKLKKVKSTIKQIEINLTAQRDRIDRMLKLERKLSWAQFDQFYFSHGLISFIAKKQIWTISSAEKQVNCIWLDDKWKNCKGEEVKFETENATAELWHPVKSNIEEIRSWREFLEKNQLSQPVKQAFREVYILTDAEINTRVYSNRMAAHVLKQHQFNSLANIRGWKYTLLGAYDNGMFNQAATIELPEYNLKAEFWVNEINADDAFNDTGIWNYIATDQVRYTALNNQDPIELTNIPAVVFSEVMRDVDLFVGVASVGNDPTWQDSGGIPAYRDYWQSYSFGDLSEVAKTRKEILQKLLPKLKIASISTIQDKFLVVKGKLRTYKIHIGSTNILMEPNDQYLCIVPDRSKPNTENLFIPFEGDSGLSVIISKALLLSEDDKITDSTITSQINRK
ncbi:MAG: DUF4132 domain-containing protein [Bacteroidetes bacterium]|nr:DUF4132 domain-containing protein [Bacteroidota bacterium]